MPLASVKSPIVSGCLSITLSSISLISLNDLRIQPLQLRRSWLSSDYCMMLTQSLQGDLFGVTNYYERDFFVFRFIMVRRRLYFNGKYMLPRMKNSFLKYMWLRYFVTFVTLLNLYMFSWRMNEDRCRWRKKWGNTFSYSFFGCLITISSSPFQLKQASYYFF